MKSFGQWLLSEMPYANIPECPYCGYHIGLYDAHLEDLSGDKNDIYRKALRGDIPFPVKCPSCKGIFDWDSKANKAIILNDIEQEQRKSLITPSSEIEQKSKKQES